MSQTEPLTYRVEQLAAALGISKVSIFRLISSGKLPRPAKLGRINVWPVQEIQSWLEAGSPDRATWEAAKRAKAGRAR